MIKGFKNFLFQGNVVVIAIGLIVALAFSMLIAAFTTNIIDPVISRIQGKNTIGLGVQLGQAGNPATFLNIGAFISAAIYFRDLYRGRLLLDRGPLQIRPGPSRHHCFRRPAAGQNVPGLLVGRPPARCVQVQILRHRAAATAVIRDGAPRSTTGRPGLAHSRFIFLAICPLLSARASHQEGVMSETPGRSAPPGTRDN